MADCDIGWQGIALPCPYKIYPFNQLNQRPCPYEIYPFDH
jgi:hypothetical protein